MPPRRDDGQVRISEACVSPAWTAQSSHNCLQAISAAFKRHLFIRRCRLFPCGSSSHLCSPLVVRPCLFVEVYFGWAMSGLSTSPTHRQQAHDVASHRHPPQKGHNRCGPPDSGNSHVVSRFSTQRRVSAEDFFPLVTSPLGSRLGKKQT